MRRNRVKEIWTSGGTARCGWLQIPNTWSAELMAHAGWDCLTIDLQHGLHNIETAIQMLQAISTSETVPLARVNWNEPGSIMRLLDGGAYGIICPMVNSREECEAFVGACRYAPDGYRSLGPTRARLYGGPDYGEHANQEVLAIAMIETRKAVDDLDNILSVPGLDAILVGSGDLKLSYTGRASHEVVSEDFEQAIDRILAACKKHGIVPGIWNATVASAAQMSAKGFRFLALQSDSMILNEHARRLAAELKDQLSE